MAIAMRASGDLKPKAMRVMSRILVLTDSVRPLDSPCSIAARIDGVWATMLFCSFTNAGIRHRRAQLTQRSNASRARQSVCNITGANRVLAFHSVACTNTPVNTAVLLVS
jgi:hypothetical protein